jgi:hypothetical protein
MQAPFESVAAATSLRAGSPLRPLREGSAQAKTGLAWGHPSRIALLLVLKISVATSGDVEHSGRPAPEEVSRRYSHDAHLARVLG